MRNTKSDPSRGVGFVPRVVYAHIIFEGCFTGSLQQLTLPTSDHRLGRYVRGRLKSLEDPNPQKSSNDAIIVPIILDEHTSRSLVRRERERGWGQLGEGASVSIKGGFREAFQRSHTRPHHLSCLSFVLHFSR